MAVEKIINLKVNDDIKETEGNVVSLKRQLREAQQDVQALSDKFGATSAQAVEAAKKAAELKDRIGDAKNLTDAFNPDAKFKALSSSIQGVASGFAAYQGALGLAGVESKRLQEQLLQVQSAMALAQGLQGLGEARDSFKQLGAVAKSVFAGIKNAIGATGIGLLVIALGAIYAYWDDIKEAVNGVSQEQKNLNALAIKNVDAANENLKVLKSTDNTLKLQGKSEKEILQIKIKATQEAIDSNVKRVKGLELTNKLEAEAAQRNYERLKSFLDFVSLPQRVLFETAATAINKVIDLVNKIPGIEIKGRMDEKFVSKATDYITKLAFDPEKTKAEGAANLKATQDAIRDLTNERDGYRLNQNKSESKSNKELVDNNKEASEEQLRILKAENEERNKFHLDREKADNEFYDAEEKARQANLMAKMTAKEAELYLIEEKYKAQLQYAKDNNFKAVELENQKANEINDVELKYQEKKKTRLEEEAEAEKNKDEVIASSKENLTNIINGLESTGLSKSKGIQAISKAIALTQIGIDTAVAIGNASKLATAEGAKAAAIGGPGAGTIARIVSYASSYAQVLSNFMKAKTMLSSGGGGGGASGSGGGGGAAAAAPSFNIVGQNSNNQLAQTIAGQQQQPIQAYVVSGNVSSAQSLDRNRIDTATFN